MITGNFLLDILVNLLVAALGGAITFAIYRLLTRDTPPTDAKH